MTRVYTLPFGVVPQLPASLDGVVALGDTCADGLVRAIYVDRTAVRRVTISAQFGRDYRNPSDTDETVVWVHAIFSVPEQSRISAGGGWSVTRACPLEP